MNVLNSKETIIKRQSHTSSVVSFVSWPEYNADPTYASLFDEVQET